MKKTGWKLIGLILCLMISSQTAFAIPVLQLDISNGAYDNSTQTIKNTSNPFTLYALLNDSSLLSDNFYISAALLPKTSSGGSYGSFIFGNQTVNITGDMAYGKPPKMPDHDVFQTYYKEFTFNFSNNDKATAYNTQDNPGGFFANPNGTLYYKAFNIDVGAVAEGYSIHFDLYNKVPVIDKKTGAIIGEEVGINAPFSHDAQGIPETPPDNPPEVPEPATLALLGFGLLGLGWVGRNRYGILDK